MTLVSELPKEPSVLDGEYGLIREGLEQIHHLGREAHRLLAPDHESPEDLLLEEKRNGDHRPVAVSLERGADTPDIVVVLVEHVHDLERGTEGHRPSGHA